MGKAYSLESTLKFSVIGHTFWHVLLVSQKFQVRDQNDTGVCLLDTRKQLKGAEGFVQGLELLNDGAWIRSSIGEARVGSQGASEWPEGSLARWTGESFGEV